MPKLIDLTGKKFGRLTVIGSVAERKCGKILWLCQCVCGKTISTRGNELKRHNTESCGCLRKEKLITRMTTHGHAKRDNKSRIYITWVSMIKRCTNHHDARYYRYGGRGITVCKKWKKFENFLEDMGEPPTNKHVIDRIDNDKGYYLSNCRWVTTKESNRNTSQNRLLTYQGVTQCVADWAEQLGFQYITLISRLDRGWSVKRALTQPANEKMSRR